MLNPSQFKNRLPWDNPQLRKTDAIALLLSLLAMLLVMIIKLPPLPKAKLIPDNFDQIDRTILIPPPIVEAPKPKPIETPKEDKKDTKTKTPEKVEVKPKEVYKPKLDEVKAIPKAAAPTKADEVASAPPKATALPKAETSGTPASKEGSSGVKTDQPNQNSAAGAAQAAAKERAVQAVRDTGLANALQGLDTLEPGAADSKDLYSGKAPTTGDLKVSKNRKGGNGTGGGNGSSAGSSSGKGGTTFGSATGSDGTGVSGSGLGARNTKGVGSGSEIKDKAKAGHGAMDVEAKADSASGKRTDVNRVMNQAQGGVQRAFKRALDEDPTLGGKVSVRIKISPSGDVTSASIASSDLNNPALESKILAIVKGLNFASGNFDVYEGKYDFNFVGE